MLLQRTFKIEPETWKKALTKAKKYGYSISNVIRNFLNEWVKE
jgi:lipocalin